MLQWHKAGGKLILSKLTLKICSVIKIYTHKLIKCCKRNTKYFGRSFTSQRPKILKLTCAWKKLFAYNVSPLSVFLMEREGNEKVAVLLIAVLFSIWVMRSKRQASWLSAGVSATDGLSASLTAGRNEPGARELARGWKGREGWMDETESCFS